MMTVITEITIEPGQEPQWDRAFTDRVQGLQTQPGWVNMQLLIPLDGANKRLVVGTWQTRADWEAWHTTEPFQRTREQMDAVQQSSSPEQWYEVVTRESAGG